jgi:hypothetical protein
MARKLWGHPRVATLALLGSSHCVIGSRRNDYVFGEVALPSYRQQIKTADTIAIFFWALSSPAIF